MPRCLLQLYHKWYSTQYSSNNAWNVNNDGNCNNNNKYNELTAIPLAELINRMDTTGEYRYRIPLYDIWEAYFACIKHKRWTANAMMFNANLERNITRLWKELNDGSYQIGRSVAFIVEHPVKREVFAADFRDRIVHDFVCLRLEPLFEKVMPNNMTSNRKNKGTHYAIGRVYDAIKRVSDNYTRDAWIWKFDLQGFFMSIDKRILNSKLQVFIDENYNAEDKHIVKWLVEKIIYHCPQKNCVRKSKPCAWVGLRPDKSLFNQDDYHGMPIGNLPSQMFANFLLKDMVAYLKENGFTEHTQFVDDGACIHGSKAEILAFIPKLRKWLKESLGISLHPNKCYIQHYTKGVSFVGALIKPHRIYISKRTRRKMLAKTYWMTHKDGLKNNLMSALQTVNSYFGQTRHTYNYKLRLQVARELLAFYGGKIYFNNNCEKMIISKL